MGGLLESVHGRVRKTPWFGHLGKDSLELMESWRKKIQTRSFLSKLASGPNSPSCNLFGPGSRQYFTIFPANPGRIVVACFF